jgi:UDP-glucose 4-epimerase
MRIIVVLVKSRCHRVYSYCIRTLERQQDKPAIGDKQRQGEQDEIDDNALPFAAADVQDGSTMMRANPAAASGVSQGRMPLSAGSSSPKPPRI